MSRIPPSSTTRSPYKPPPSPAKSRVGASTPTRARTKSTTRSTTPSKPPIENDYLTSVPALSIKEAIALKRAEAKKPKTGGSGLGSLASLEDALPTTASRQDDDDILGRWSVKEAIERARSTGSLNISTRSLPCIPSALFEIHLGITPDRLKSVPNEPPLPASSPADTHPTSRRGARRDAPTWFEALDLQILKAWSNDIVEIQHEISLFGSLKTIDLHKNQITSLPDTFADLTALTSIDLSHNALTSFPTNIFTLPELTSLNISHNSLTSLPFNAPFASADKSRSRSNYSSGSFFVPAITRASTPLPRLLTLDASYNKLSASAIDLTIPASINKFDLSVNPLGIGDSRCQSLFHALGSLEKLRELRFENAEIGDDALPENLFSPSSSPFPNLRVLDLGETKVTPDAAKAALKGMKQEVSFDMTTEDPPKGVTRIIVGKKVVREPWEIEVERRTKARTVRNTETGPETEETAAFHPAKSPEKGAKVEVVKEAWEIEAEQGLLTEGGKRRARAAAAAAAAEKQSASTLGIGAPSTAPANGPVTQSTTSFTLTNQQYYSQTTQTLTLPPSTPPSKSPGHARTFSLASPSSSSWSLAPSRTTDIALPTATLPLAIIVAQPFAQALKVLVLANRRMDRSFTLPFLPEGGEAVLPNLEELNLEGCGLADLVSVSHANSTSGSKTPPRSSELMLPLLTRTFPSLRTLNLSYNALTSSCLTTEALSALILATSNDGSHEPQRKGLKHLRLRGNRLNELDGLQGVADLFKGNREVPGWKLDELDLRDNEIGKLPPELGLLPLDVCLVDGNVFRVPQRRVWEREGTKGLLSWLRGRVE